jgi:hypothetical protein
VSGENALKKDAANSTGKSKQSASPLTVSPETHAEGTDQPSVQRREKWQKPSENHVHAKQGDEQAKVLEHQHHDGDHQNHDGEHHGHKGEEEGNKHEEQATQKEEPNHGPSKRASVVTHAHAQRTSPASSSSVIQRGVSLPKTAGTNHAPAAVGGLVPAAAKSTSGLLKGSDFHKPHQPNVNPIP